MVLGASPAVTARLKRTEAALTPDRQMHVRWFRV